MHARRRSRRAPWFGAGAVVLLATSVPPVWGGSAAVPNLVVNTTASASPIGSGQRLTLTITVTNSGGIAPEPSLVNTLPKGMVLQSVTNDRGTECTTAEQEIRCPLGPALERAETAKVVIVAIPVDPGTLTNKAVATSVGLGTIGNTSSTPVAVTGAEVRCFGVVPTIFGTDGDDTIDGTPADDVIVGFGGKDAISGGGGNDKICGGDGNDQLDGGSGADMLDGGDGNDVVSGGAGADVVQGGNGKDVLVCDKASDVCDGGEGVDTFVTVPN
ncbi:MAG: hypothetical protein ACT4QG_17740 [Sporichthyaceae bacterium]